MTRVVNDVDPIEEEPGFDAEVDALLQPGNRELLRGVQAKTLRAMGLAPSPARFRYLPMALAASVAALALVAIWPVKTEAPTGDLRPVFYGELEASRGTQDKKHERVYGPEGTLRVELSQSRAASRVPAGILRVFEVDGKRHLRELPLRIRRAEDAAGVVFSFEAKVSAVFGATPSGTKTLALVVGGSSSDLSELAGEELSSVQARQDLRCFIEEIAIVSR